MKYKCISLWQPWAQLLVTGHKKIETRGWDTSYRGLLLIHAAQTQKPGFDFCLENEPSIASILHFKNLPFGAIIGAVNLIHTITSESSYLAESVGYGNYKWMFSEKEKMFGDYSPGRFLWLTGDPVVFPEPIPAKGLQRIWNFSTDQQLTLPKKYLPPTLFN